MFHLFWRKGRNSSRRNEESQYSGFVIFEHQIRNTRSNGRCGCLCFSGNDFRTPLSKDSDFCLTHQLSHKPWVYVLISSLKENFPISYKKMYYFKIIRHRCTLQRNKKKQKTFTIPNSVLPFLISLRLEAAKIAVFWYGSKLHHKVTPVFATIQCSNKA